MDNKNIILLSYPRSGNTFTRYILEYLTGFSSSGYNNDFDKPLINHSSTPSQIYKRHGHTEEEEEYFIDLDPDHNKLVFLLRHPYECWNRHNNRDNPIPIDRYWNIINNGDDLNIKNIIRFDNFSGQKIIVFYEDLILNHTKYVETLGSFLKVERKRVESMIADFEQHKMNAKRLYVPGTHTLNREKNPMKLIKFYRTVANISEQNNISFLEDYGTLLQSKNISRGTTDQIIGFYRSLAVNREQQ